MMHGLRGYFRFAHIDDHIAADPAVYVRLPKLQSDETRTQGLDRLELIRFPHHASDSRWRISTSTEQGGSPMLLRGATLPLHEELDLLINTARTATLDR